MPRAALKKLFRKDDVIDPEKPFGLKHLLALMFGAQGAHWVGDSKPVFGHVWRGKLYPIKGKNCIQ